MNIKSIIIVLFIAGSCYAQKEGFFQTFITPQPRNDGNDFYPVFEVPLGKKFILQRLYVEGSNIGWFILKDVEKWDVLLGGQHYHKSYCSNLGGCYGYGTTHTKMDFPDGSAVLQQKTKLYMTPAYWNTEHFYTTLVGYFEKLPDCPKADLTGDCIVDFRDLAMLASEWLKQ